MTRQGRRRKEREKQEGGEVKNSYYETLERFVNIKGGILFIAHRDLTNKNGQEVRVVRDEPHMKSAIFEFNIGNPAGLSTMFECEKALSDQTMSIEFIHDDLIWFGGSLEQSEFKYLSSTYDNPGASAPVSQKELVDRVNQTIDKCSDYMGKSINESKMIHVNASNRMNGYLCNTKLGTFIQEKYPELISSS